MIDKSKGLNVWVIVNFSYSGARIKFSEDTEKIEKSFGKLGLQAVGVYYYDSCSAEVLLEQNKELLDAFGDDDKMRSFSAKVIDVILDILGDRRRGSLFRVTSLFRSEGVDPTYEYSISWDAKTGECYQKTNTPITSIHGLI